MPYHNLGVFKKAYGLSLEVHKISLHFPKFEQFEIAQQLRRASKSIPVNIAEGMGRQASSKDVIHFMRIAIGSCDETRIWLEFARDLEYLPDPDQKRLDAQYNEVGRMLQGIIKRYSSQAG